MDGITFSLVPVADEISPNKKVYRAYVKTNGTLDKEGTVKVSGVDTDGQPKTAEIPSGAITSWADGEIRVEGEGWEPISAQLDLANPIGIVAVCGPGESNALEATVYA